VGNRKLGRAFEWDAEDRTNLVPRTGRQLDLPAGHPTRPTSVGSQEKDQSRHWKRAARLLELSGVPFASAGEGTSTRVIGAVAIGSPSDTTGPVRPQAHPPRKPRRTWAGSAETVG
jgi:hypothetical protein